MNENLIVEDNTIYEIDPECLKKKRKCQGETGEKVVFYRLYDKF